MVQLAITAVVWLGMAFFYSDMKEESRVIFYLVTSWLLFLLVIISKAWLKNRNRTKK